MKYHTFKDQDVIGWFASEKFDGMFFYWDGEKLLTSRGNVLYAPSWWINKHMPKGIQLEGELWAGYGNFQTVCSVCRKKYPTNDWMKIEPKIFNIPKMGVFFKDLKPEIEKFGLTYWEITDEDTLWRVFRDVTNRGGEGIVIRSPYNVYTEGRSSTCLKLKRIQDAEATIIGYAMGRGKYSGMLGAYIINWNDKIFEIGTGMDDAERANPRPIGSIVRFHYRELTNSGVPKEAKI